MRLAPAVCVSIVPLLSVPFLAVAEWTEKLPQLEPAEAATSAADEEVAEAARAATVAADWAELVHLVDVLQHGKRAEKLALFEDGEGESALMNLEDPPGEDERAVRAVVSAPRDWFRVETDVLVLDLAAQDLAAGGFESARSIFSDLATHHAPSLRARAIANATELEEPEDLELIEAMWAVETVPWVQAELLQARLEFGPSPDTQECAALLESDDAELAAAAVACVASDMMPEAGELLAVAAAAGNGSTRLLALEALANWLVIGGPTPTVAAAVRALWQRDAFPGRRALLLRALSPALPLEAAALARDLAWDEDEPVARVAIEILSRSADEGATELLMARAHEGPPTLRAAAIEAMDAVDLPGEVSELLVTLLERAEPQKVRVAAAQVLGGGRSLRFISSSVSEVAWASRLAFAPLLQTLADSDPDAVVQRAANESPLIATGDSILVGHCTFWGISSGEFSDPDPAFTVRPPADGASVRCYHLPGVELAPDDALRVTVGEVGTLDSRFDDGVESWLFLDFEADSCWLRQNRVGRVDPLEDAAVPGSSLPGGGLSDRAGWEVDLPLATTSAPWFLRLEGAGIVKTFDRGETLIGVAVVQPLSVAQRAALLPRDDWEDTPLADLLRAALEP